MAHLDPPLEIDDSTKNVAIVTGECVECGDEFSTILGEYGPSRCPDCRPAPGPITSASDRPLMEYGPLSEGRHR